jgi:hypothetical protein
VTKKKTPRAIAENLAVADRSLIALAVIAIVAGVCCRVEGLTRRSLWLDEVVTVRRISYPTALEVVYRLKDTPFPPLYYVALWFWTRVWGISVASLRMLPAILGVVALPATYFVWRGLIGRRAALWAVVLLSSSSFLIWYSQDAKMYAAVWLLATIAGGAFLHALREQRHRLAWLGAYAISNTAILLTSYVGIVPVVVQGLYGALLVARKRPRGRYVVEAAFIAFISSVPIMIWLTLSHRAATTRSGIEWIRPTPGDRWFTELIQHFTTFLVGFQSVAVPKDDVLGRLIIQGALWLLAVICGVVVVYWARLARDNRAIARSGRSPTLEANASVNVNQLSRSDVGVYLTLWALLPPLGVFLFSILVYPLWGVPRYLVASAPGLFLLVASSLAALKPRALALGVGLLLATVNMGLVVFGKTHTTLIPWRDLVRTASHVANALPGPDGDPARLPEAVSLVHHNDLSIDSYNWMCVEFELNCLEGVPHSGVTLRFETLPMAAGRGEAFMIIEHDALAVSVDQSRETLGRAIADAAGPAAFTLREIETVRVFMAGATILPNPLIWQSATLWLALPARRHPGGVR